MDLYNTHIDKAQYKILSPFFKYLSSFSSFHTVVKEMPIKWTKTRISLIKSANALDSCGLGHLTDIIIDDIINALYVRSEHPNSKQCHSHLSLTQLTPILYNMIQVAKKDQRFQKINSIPREDLNNFFPKLNEQNIESFISFCKDDLIDIPHDIRERIVYDSLVTTPYKTSINLGIDLLSLYPSVDFLNFTYDSLCAYFTKDPLLTDIKVDALKIALKNIDSEKAHLLEKRLNNNKQPLSMNHHISINMDIEVIEVSRSKMNLKDASFHKLLIKVVECIEKQQELPIFKDFINKSNYAKKIAATLNSINDKTLAYLYSHLEFSYQNNEDIQYKEKIIHDFFDKVILLDNKATDEMILELMRNTLLFHEMERDLPTTSSVRRVNKI